MNKSKHGKITPGTNKRKSLFIVLSFLIIASVFGQVYKYDYGIDDQLINQNIPGRTEGIKGILHLFGERYNKADYRPIVTVSYSVEKWITGESNPHVSHLINLLLYFLLIIVLYNTLNNLLPAQYKIIISISLLLFIVHPVHTEVVAGLKSRDNLLSMLFTVLSAKYLFKYILVR